MLDLFFTTAEISMFLKVFLDEYKELQQNKLFFDNNGSPARLNSFNFIGDLQGNKYIFSAHTSENILELLRSAISIALFHLGRQILQGNCI